MYRKKEQGAVLIVSLVMMVLITALVVSALKSSNLQEIMTSNSNNHVTAMMAAEAGAADFAVWLAANYDPDDSADQMKTKFGHKDIASAEQVGSGDGYYYLDQLTTGAVVEATVTGLATANTTPLTVLSRYHVRLQLTASPGTVKPFENAVIGCEGVSTQGSGQIDSFDSRVAPYDSTKPGSNADVITTEPGADVELIGNAPIYGDVFSTGDIYSQGSAPIYGETRADNDIRLKGGGVNFYGDIYSGNDLIFESSATAHADVYANGDIEFNNYSASVGGNAQAGGTIAGKNKNKPVEDYVGGSVNPGMSPGNPSVAGIPCDPLDVDSIVDSFSGMTSTGDFTVGSYPKNDWRLTPDGVSYYDETWDVKEWVNDDSKPLVNMDVMGTERPVLVVDDMSLKNGQGELHISGGDVVIFVDGDFNLGGSNEIKIDDDSSLTVITTGTFDLGGSVDVANGSTLNTNGNPRFSLYSNYDQSQANKNSKAGVRIGANDDMTSVVYAPKSDVDITGSGELFGSVRGRTVDVTGNGGMHYDEALGDADIGGGTSSGVPGITQWKAVWPE